MDQTFYRLTTRKHWKRLYTTSGIKLYVHLATVIDSTNTPKCNVFAHTHYLYFASSHMSHHNIVIISRFSIQGNAHIVAQWPISSKRREIKQATVHFWRKDEHLGPWAGYVLMTWTTRLPGFRGRICCLFSPTVLSVILQWSYKYEMTYKTEVNDYAKFSYIKRS